MLITNNHTLSQFLVSVKKDTNKVISSSEDSFGGIGPGHYIKIGNSDILYPILKVNKFFYFKDFEAVNLKEILIKDDPGINLQLNDTLDIIFDEYELVAVEEIINPGSSYSVGDVLTVLGGQTSIDINNGIGYSTKFKVEEIGIMGEIRRVSCIDYGKYIVPPNLISKVFCERLGKETEFKLQYNPIQNKKISKRVIKEININNNLTSIKLDYSLPIGLKSGKLSIEKWEIELASKYLEETKYCTDYKIIKDFTPNIKLPLLIKNSLSTDVIYNKAMNLIDAELMEIKTRLLNLEKSLTREC